MVETTAPGEAATLVRRARQDGVDVVAVMGGDGTLNEVAQAFIDAEGQAVEGPAIAVVPAGTGGDYKRTLGLSGDLDEAIDRIAQNNPRTLDLGSMRCLNERREPVIKAFINITSFGAGGVIDKLVNESPKWLGGKVSFYIGSFRGMLRYRNQMVRVKVDGEPFCETPVFSVAMCIGRYFGGSMFIAPDADPADGLFDVVSLGDLSRLELVSLTNKIYKGAHLSVPGVLHTRGRVVEAEPVHPWTQVLIDMDGETPGMLPLTARVLKGAVRVL